MKATNDVTEAFRRTAGLMQQELERSVLTQQMFGASFVSPISLSYLLLGVYFQTNPLER